MPNVTTKGEIGIDPPVILILIGSFLKVFTIALLSHIPHSESNGVWKAP